MKNKFVGDDNEVRMPVTGNKDKDVEIPTGDPEPEVIVKDFDPVRDIIEFHTKFNMVYNGPPRNLAPGTQAMDEIGYRLKFDHEEQLEYENAVMNRDLVGQLDALIDKMYIILGTLYLQGFPIEEAWHRVHKSNMSKELVPVGEGKWGGRIKKGKDFEPPEPDLNRLIKDKTKNHEE